ncbi:MAG: hypothetical protein HQK57_09880 [Deltaproteobacteria bacterium]|nr:hypothetical protein [Deltaproteobacteria bacterium]
MKYGAALIPGLALTVFICCGSGGMVAAQSPPGSSSIKLVPPPGASSATSAPNSSTIERPRAIPTGSTGSRSAAPVVIMSTPAPYGGVSQPAPVYRTKTRKTDPPCPYCGSETRFTGYVLDGYENKCYAEFQCLQFTDHQTRNEVDSDNCQ